VDELRKEIATLRQELTAYQKQLKRERATVRKVYSPAAGFGPGALDSVALDEPNPQIDVLRRKIAAARDAISRSTKEIGDLMNPAKSEATLQAANRTAEERKTVLATLQRSFGDPVAVADQAVKNLAAAKVIEGVPNGDAGTDDVPARKALLYKAMILNMGTSAEHWDSVRVARPEMTFKAVKYEFKFVTRAGLVRVNTGYILLCGIEDVWWPMQANVDGVEPEWEAYRHPITTPVLWQQVADVVKQAPPNAELILDPNKNAVIAKPSKGRE
jgi:hypothetical protein